MNPATAMLMLFGAKAVIDGELSVGGLVAFNMIAAQVAQPILRKAVGERPGRPPCRHVEI